MLTLLSLPGMSSLNFYMLKAFPSFSSRVKITFEVYLNFQMILFFRFLFNPLRLSVDVVVVVLCSRSSMKIYLISEEQITKASYLLLGKAI